MKLKIIVPVNSTAFTSQIRDSIQPVLFDGVKVDIESITQGTPYIQSRADLATNAPYVMKLAQQAEQDGYDGIFVTDVDMCGVEAARQLVSIPIIGGFQASAYTAMMLAEKFSILTVADVAALQQEHVRTFGITDNFASIHTLPKTDVPNIADPNYFDDVLKTLVKLGMKAVEQHGAEAIMFGCTGFFNYAQPLSHKLTKKLSKKRGEKSYIPVMDANCCALSYLMMLVKNRLSQSQITYPVRHN